MVRTRLDCSLHSGGSGSAIIIRICESYAQTSKSYANQEQIPFSSKRTCQILPSFGNSRKYMPPHIEVTEFEFSQDQHLLLKRNECNHQLEIQLLTSMQIFVMFPVTMLELRRASENLSLRILTIAVSKRRTKTRQNQPSSCPHTMVQVQQRIFPRLHQSRPLHPSKSPLVPLRHTHQNFLIHPPLPAPNHLRYDRTATDPASEERTQKTQFWRSKPSSFHDLHSADAAGVISRQDQQFHSDVFFGKRRSELEVVVREVIQSFHRASDNGAHESETSVSSGNLFLDRHGATERGWRLCLKLGKMSRENVCASLSFTKVDRQKVVAAFCSPFVPTMNSF